MINEREFLEYKIDNYVRMLKDTKHNEYRKNIKLALNEVLEMYNKLENDEIRKVPYCIMCKSNDIKIFENYDDTFECKNCSYVFTMDIQYSGKDVLEMQDIVVSCIKELNWILEESDCRNTNHYATNCIHYLLHTMLPILQKDEKNRM